MPENSDHGAAIALTYDGENAPTVAATGQNELAHEMIRIAEENGVPLYEDPDLAALLSRLDLGESIPETLYQIIAEVLAYSFYLQGFTPDDFRDADRER
ncbi:EscU/YscU/HrcU family type III secretion system export apparatus switch protein [Salicola sp. Rm-C-2C1-2]|uniref:EscU/YscU/HrcU family type III secretion system export apparatus switch protein n=1 Tax=Salicola sp. Rm-C-2C1-2 TaxID=3141321 RepID=UPI0032E460DE